MMRVKLLTAIRKNEVALDSDQKRVLEQLIHLGQRLENPTFISRFKKRLVLKHAPVKGLYIWGSVGRGKTFLMDLFFDSLDFKQKKRMHFHHFMKHIHEQLKLYQGHADPLRLIARNFAKDTRLLCFDEFYVNDIADAMLLGGILSELFSHGLSFVATSNVEPDKLYANGLQRDKFLPAIALIKKWTHIIEMGGALDYRLRVLQSAELYHHPLDQAAHKQLENTFKQLAPFGSQAQSIEVMGRDIPVEGVADSVIWFDFKELCMGARSTQDYVEIARTFHTLLLSNVKQMSQGREDAARRFVALVDECYERRVTLVVSADCAIEDLYKGSQLSFEFQRTTSRLQEMQSEVFLSLAHLG